LVKTKTFFAIFLSLNQRQYLDLTLDLGIIRRVLYRASTDPFEVSLLVKMAKVILTTFAGEENRCQCCKTDSVFRQK